MAEREAGRCDVLMMVYFKTTGAYKIIGGLMVPMNGFNENMI
jgi:hypothetical protein